MYEPRWHSYWNSDEKGSVELRCLHLYFAWEVVRQAEPVRGCKKLVQFVGHQGFCRGRGHSWHLILQAGVSIDFPFAPLQNLWGKELAGNLDIVHSVNWLQIHDQRDSWVELGSLQVCITQRHFWLQCKVYLLSSKISSTFALPSATITPHKPHKDCCCCKELWGQWHFPCKRRWPTMWCSSHYSMFKSK